MEIFRADGHLTDEALSALTEGRPLEELARLEMAEHLAFCDLCLQRYTDALAGTELAAPPASCREGLWRRVRARAIRLVTSRYATAAAAVLLALTLVWSDIGRPTDLSPDPPAVSHRIQSHLAWWNDSLDRAVSGLADLLDAVGGRLSESTQGGIHS